MKPLTTSLLAVASIAVVLGTLLRAQEGKIVRILREYCNPTSQEAEWLAAFEEVRDDDAKLLHYNNTIVGPETLLPEPEGTILTGLWDGRIVRLLDELHVQHLATSGAQHGDECRPFYQRDPAKRCSRVLGLNFETQPQRGDKDRVLVLCDGWRGLLMARVPSQGEVDKGAAPTHPEEMRELLKGDGHYIIRIPNGVTEALDGHHYMTDSCVHSDAGNLGLIFFEGSTSGCGKLLKVNVKDDTAELVGKGIPFANGVVPTHDRRHVLVSALNARQIRKYPLNPETFDDWSVLAHLPINPDNLSRVTIHGEKLYTAVGFRDLFLPPFSILTESNSLLHQMAAAASTAWKRFVREYLPLPRLGGNLMPLLFAVPARYLNNLLERVARRSSHGGQVAFFDEEGKIVKWLSLPAKCRFSSEAIVHQWPGSQGPVMLVASFSKHQSICQIRLDKYFKGPSR